MNREHDLINFYSVCWPPLFEQLLSALNIRPTHSLSEIFTLQLHSPPASVPRRSSHRRSCAGGKKPHKFIISFSISDRLPGRRSGSLKCRRGLPSAALPCLPAGLQSKFTASVETSVSSQRQRGSEREQYGTSLFFLSTLPLPPSTDARTCRHSDPEGL